MFLVVGLGNPGSKYAGNRHNVGFMAVDALAKRADSTGYREKFKGLYGRGRLAGEDVIFLKPMTFMNLSGESVQPAMKFFKVPLDHVIVVHDELDLAFGTVRLKNGGGAAGHNGLRSIIQHGGGNGFIRTRVGIGRPRSGSVQGFVLRDFDSSESAELPNVLEDATRAVESVLNDGLSKAMNVHNTRKK